MITINIFKEWTKYSWHHLHLKSRAKSNFKNVGASDGGILTNEDIGTTLVQFP